MSGEDDWGDLITKQEKGLTEKIESLAIKKESGENSSASKEVSPSGSHSETSQPSESRDDAEEKDVSKSDISLLQKLLHSKLVQSKSDIEVLRKDPTSPLYSVKSFEALHLKPELLKGVYDMGFNAPSKIQETALPTLLADPPTNMIAQSQSGTGKTAAFVLTMLSRVDVSKNYPQCLCLAPTYELALQIGEVTKEMSKFMSGLRIMHAVRGERVSRGDKLDCHILIGTPGTTQDWATRFGAFDLKKIKVFVLDEADVMISLQGHQDQSYRLQKGLSPNCQMLLFSATYDESVMAFAEKIIPNDPVIIKLRREEESLDNIKQYYIECSSQEEKFEALSNIYGAISIGQSMIFCATRRTASTLAERMTKDGHAVGLLSGELPIEMRADIIKRFRDGKEKVLITTNVSARGIDVEQVTVVVNFDLPVTPDNKPDCETYLHRIGRTGRFGKNGIAINFVDGQRSMTTMRYIEKHFAPTKILSANFLAFLLSNEICEEEPLQKIGASYTNLVDNGLSALDMAEYAGRTISKLDAGDLDAIEKISS